MAQPNIRLSDFDFKSQQIDKGNRAYGNSEPLCNFCCGSGCETQFIKECSKCNGTGKKEKK